MNQNNISHLKNLETEKSNNVERKLRIIAVLAHPDDAEVKMGGGAQLQSLPKWDMP